MKIFIPNWPLKHLPIYGLKKLLTSFLLTALQGILKKNQKLITMESDNNN